MLVYTIHALAFLPVYPSVCLSVRLLALSFGQSRRHEHHSHGFFRGGVTSLLPRHSLLGAALRLRSDDPRFQFALPRQPVSAPPPLPPPKGSFVVCTFYSSISALSRRRSHCYSIYMLNYYTLHELSYCWTMRYHPVFFASAPLGCAWVEGGCFVLRITRPWHLFTLKLILRLRARLF